MAATKRVAGTDTAAGRHHDRWIPLADMGCGKQRAVGSKRHHNVLGAPAIDQLACRGQLV